MKKIGIIQIYSLIHFAFLFNSCGKEAIKVNSNYEGRWVYISAGATYWMNIYITSGRDCSYKKCELCPQISCTCTEENFGKATIRKNKLNLGGRIFKIEKEPTDAGGGNWYMILDGNSFHKEDPNWGTCSDGIRNQDEISIDCGGSICPACPSCFDGIQNQDEMGVDCGGAVCSACPSCSDNLQNQGEQGIDCGGPCNYSCVSKFTWKMDKASQSNPSFFASYSSSKIKVFYTNGNFIIYPYSSSGFLYMILQFNSTGIGTFNFTSNTYTANGQNANDPYMYQTGSINISTFDTSLKRISGTYSFNCANDTGAIRQVTNGIITDLSYP